MFSLLLLNSLPILQQLHIEEALLRTETGPWCLINTGAPDAIVMGISGNVDSLVDISHAQRLNAPIIRRYSGGGTVYIDADTIFITLIGNGEQTPHSLLEFGHQLYAPLFPPHFALQANDYVIGDRKIGGNAQYLQRHRWVHHTSFLWNFDTAKMQSLHLPVRRPDYRCDRPHHTFLTTLNSHFPCKNTWIDALCRHLQATLPATPTPLDFTTLLERPHRRTSRSLV